MILKSPRGIEPDAGHYLNRYSDWLAYLLASQTPANQLPEADPDQDQLSNFVEFAFALDPNRPSTTDEYAVSSLQTSTTNGQRYLHFTFVRRIDRTEIDYLVAVSDDLSTWDRTQSQLVQVGPPVATGDGQTEQVTYRVLANPAITDRRYVRLEINPIAAP